MKFTRAEEVSPGDPITSRQYRALARAFNDRLRSGAGDGVWRIFYALHGLFRSIRNLVEEDEFWALRQAIDPASGTEWPAALPGEPGGANVSNPLAAFVFGSPAMGTAAEAERMAEIPFSDSVALSDAEAWALGAAQCGAYDPATGAMGCPSFTAARAHFRIAYSPRSEWGRSFGGFQPNPTAQNDCEDPDPDDENPAPLDYEIFFTSTVIGQDATGLHGAVTTTGDGYTRVTYAGTCQPAPGNSYDSHVAGIVEMPWSSYVRVNDGTVDELPASLWVQGPYEGAASLRRPELSLQRVLHTFVREFRGSDAQRSEPPLNVDESVPFEEFLSRQYLLAPALGVQEAGSVRAVETVFEWTASGSPAARARTVSGRRTDHTIREGFVVAAVYVSGSKLKASSRVAVLKDGAQVAVVDVTATGGEASQIVMLNPPIKGTIAFRLEESLQLASGGRLAVELREQLEYLPLTHDAYLFLRITSAGDYESRVDGRGLDEANAREAGERYLRQGCLVNWHGAPELPEAFTGINTNGVYDAARRWSRFVRLIRRHQIHAYAVESGTSVLWVRRFVIDPEGGDPIDCMAGIGPSRSLIPNGKLQIGQTYVVASGTVAQNGVAHHAGQTFTAVVETWLGGGTVREYSGIQHAAPEGGTTNEWVATVHLRPYHPSETSGWDVATFTDQTTQFNRCHFGSPEIANDPTSLWHYALGRRTTGSYGGALIPETPSGYNYAPLVQSWLGRTSINDIDCGETPSEACTDWRKAFYRSCRIYEPPMEIESAVADVGIGGVELVKLTFTGRLHHAPEAPASIGSDVTTWDLAMIQAESFRSIENGIREYLIHAQVGGHCGAGDLPPYDTGGPSGQPGNAAANTSYYTEPDDPFGTCYPTIVFTQLVPEPYEDDNDEVDLGVDSPFLHDPMTQMELYLRAMSEGYVDGSTSLDYACRLGVYSVFDFSFESLCLQAFGGRWIGTITDALRPDHGEGFGPLPATSAWADVFNRFTAAINLLNQVRIMLPMELQFATSSAASTTPIEVRDATGAIEPCTGGAQVVEIRTEMPDPVIDWSSPTWVSGDPIDATVGAVLDGTCGGAKWNLVVSREDVRFRWSPIDPDALEAIPEDLRAHLTDDPVVLARVTRANAAVDASLTANVNDSEHCCFVDQEPCPGVWAAGGGQWWAFPVPTDTSYVCLDAGGALTADALGEGFVAYAMTPSGAVCKIGPANRATIQVISDSTAVVAIPLTALP